MTRRGKYPSAKFVLESIAFIFESTRRFLFSLELLDFDPMLHLFLSETPFKARKLLL